MPALVEFLRPRHRLILATSRADGSTQLSPVTAGVDEQGRIVIASYPQRAKVKNLRRDPAAAAASSPTSGTGRGCRCRDAEVIDLPDAVDGLVDYFRSISGEHPDWDEYRQAMVDQGKCLVRITPERWGPIATGGFPPELAKG